MHRVAQFASRAVGRVTFVGVTAGTVALSLNIDISKCEAKIVNEAKIEFLREPSLKGKVAIVTGSSMGIGKAIAEHLVREGATVIIHSGRSVEAGESTAKELGMQYIQADVQQQDDCIRLIEETVSRFGRLDILVNNAGVNKLIPHGDLEAVDEEWMRRVFEINVFGQFWLCKAAMPYLKQSEDGNIINVTSAAGVRPGGSSIPYAMTKAAVNHMTMLLAKSHGPVRVNAIAPGLIETRITTKSDTNPAFWDKLSTDISEAIPLGRLGQPDDLGPLVIGICNSRYMTGQVIVVDGGKMLVQ